MEFLSPVSIESQPQKPEYADFKMPLSHVTDLPLAPKGRLRDPWLKVLIVSSLRHNRLKLTNCDETKKMAEDPQKTPS